MGDSVVLNDPVVLIGYIVALALCAVAFVKNAHWTVSVISALIFAAVTAYALSVGASLYELGAVAALFFAVRILPIEKEGGN